ncbi:TPA: restriction endonuclease subunit S [Staphylococcus aureus]|nr:restriction endonuclease subunit S [Staphylococcus aureus]HDE8199234.1 restriction endonuclease subunit S [Staphylococcus aureus]HDF1689050.1 restriction endonuclease subunit S [Staphylococcus aureus]HDF1805501.1 restriction endonuclease subunit S [Staphylococcus aureus]
MKDSRIEWIGEVPEDWEISTIGAHYAERTDKVSDLDYGPLSVTKSGIVPQLEIAAKSSNHDNRKLVLKDDFVINSRSDRKMSAGISNMDGSVSVINTVLYSNTIDRNYTKYLLKNYAFAEEFYRWGTGIVDDLWSTKWLKMKNIPIPVPPIEKQKQIGEVIDNMFQNTNNIINETDQSIKELKKYKQSLITESVTKGIDPNVEMKESGIDWIGYIPKNWNIEKIKYNTSTIDVKKDFVKEDIYIGLENVLSYEGRIYDYGMLLKDSKEKYFEKGNILYSKLRPYLAKAFIADITGSCSGEFIVFKNFKGNKRYLLYWLISQLFTDFINATSYGAKMPRSSWDYIKETSIPRPPKHEENEIVNYLDDKLSQINKLIENKIKIIKELETYKNSLIYEYVTGKKEV